MDVGTHLADPGPSLSLTIAAGYLWLVIASKTC